MNPSSSHASLVSPRRRGPFAAPLLLALLESGTSLFVLIVVADIFSQLDVELALLTTESLRVRSRGAFFRQNVA
jgi:hypothetical protein